MFHTKDSAQKKHEIRAFFFIFQQDYPEIKASSTAW